MWLIGVLCHWGGEKELPKEKDHWLVGGQAPLKRIGGTERAAIPKSPTLISHWLHPLLGRTSRAHEVFRGHRHTSVCSRDLYTSQEMKVLKGLG